MRCELIKPARWYDVLIGFAFGMSCFFVANLIAVHLHSDAGLLEGLGIVDRAYDDIRRVGFPFQFFEEGGIVHRRIFRPLPLLFDVVIACACSLGAGVGFSWIRGRLELQGAMRRVIAEDALILPCSPQQMWNALADFASYWRWWPTIERALAGKRNVMVLVGALHLAGKEGLIEMLRQEGFKPEQMYGIDRPHTATVQPGQRPQR